MSLISNYEEFQNICRTCLFIGKLRPIIDSVVIEIIRGITGIEVKSDTELPQNICETCYKKIYKINEFAVQCKRNELTLNKCKSEYLERKQNEIKETEAIDIKEEFEIEDEVLKIKDEIKTEHASDQPNPIEFINVGQEQQTTEVKHKCLECNKTFIKLREFVNHKRLHKKIVFECEVCSEKFKDSFALIEHHRTHKKQFPYTCDVCNKPIRHLKTLNRHKLFHRRQKAQCNVCMKIFYDFDALQVHRRNHTATTAFPCNVCHKQFSTLFFLEQHLRFEHSNLIDDADHSEDETKAQNETGLLLADPQIFLSINEESSDPGVVADTNKYMNSYNGKRLRDRNYCIFCKTTVLNFVRHITRNHLKEPEVRRVLAKPVGSRERKQLLSLMRKRGNYLINYKECTKPVKKSTSRNTAKTSFLPCVSCLGFYSANQLWKHRKVCIANGPQQQQEEQKAPRSRRTCAEAQNLLVRHLNVDRTLWEMVFPRMRPDHVSLVAKNDVLICAFGARYIRLHDNDTKKHIVNVTSRKMRELAKLLIALKQQEPSICNLSESLQPQYFDSVVAAVKTVAKYHETTKVFESPTYALQMASTLKHCCEIVLSDDDVFRCNQENVRNFITMLDSNWKVVMVMHPPAVPFPLPMKNTYNREHIETTANVDDDVDAETKRPKHGKKRVLVPWTPEQKRVVHVYFKEHIVQKRAPKKTECEALIQEHPLLLHNKNWLKIKVYVQNKYSK